MTRLGLYISLSEALRRKPRETLREAAERMARTHAHRHHGILAERVLKAGEKTGDECWEALEHAARLL